MGIIVGIIMIVTGVVALLSGDRHEWWGGVVFVLGFTVLFASMFALV